MDKVPIAATRLYLAVTATCRSMKLLAANIERLIRGVIWLTAYFLSVEHLPSPTNSSSTL